jgi:hypothetical protein
MNGINRHAHPLQVERDVLPILQIPIVPFELIVKKLYLGPNGLQSALNLLKTSRALHAKTVRKIKYAVLANATRANPDDPLSYVLSKALEAVKSANNGVWREEIKSYLLVNGKYLGGRYIELVRSGSYMPRNIAPITRLFEVIVREMNYSHFLFQANLIDESRATMTRAVQKFHAVEVGEQSRSNFFSAKNMIIMRLITPIFLLLKMESQLHHFFEEEGSLVNRQTLSAFLDTILKNSNIEPLPALQKKIFIEQNVIVPLLAKEYDVPTKRYLLEETLQLLAANEASPEDLLNFILTHEQDENHRLTLFVHLFRNSELLYKVLKESTDRGLQVIEHYISCVNDINLKRKMLSVFVYAKLFNSADSMEEHLTRCTQPLNLLEDSRHRSLVLFNMSEILLMRQVNIEIINLCLGLLKTAKQPQFCYQEQAGSVMCTMDWVPFMSCHLLESVLSMIDRLPPEDENLNYLKTVVLPDTVHLLKEALFTILDVGYSGDVESSFESQAGLVIPNNIFPQRLNKYIVLGTVIDLFSKVPQGNEHFNQGFFESLFEKIVLSYQNEVDAKKQMAELRFTEIIIKALTSASAFLSGPNKKQLLEKAVHLIKNYPLTKEYSRELQELFPTCVKLAYQLFGQEEGRGFLNQFISFMAIPKIKQKRVQSNLLKKEMTLRCLEVGEVEFAYQQAQSLELPPPSPRLSAPLKREIFMQSDLFLQVAQKYLELGKTREGLVVLESQKGIFNELNAKATQTEHMERHVDILLAVQPSATLPPAELIQKLKQAVELITASKEIYIRKHLDVVEKALELGVYDPLDQFFQDLDAKIFSIHGPSKRFYLERVQHLRERLAHQRDGAAGPAGAAL